MADVDLGLPISREEFKHRLHRYSAALDDGSKLTPEDIVEMVRLYNTIAWKHDESPEAAAFSARFDAAEVDRARDLLGMTLSKGMGFYSNEYDLYLGGVPHANSMFAVAD
jgi:hypothetical protein